MLDRRHEEKKTSVPGRSWERHIAREGRVAKISQHVEQPLLRSDAEHRRAA